MRLGGSVGGGGDGDDEAGSGVVFGLDVDDGAFDQIDRDGDGDGFGGVGIDSLVGGGFVVVGGGWGGVGEGEGLGGGGGEGCGARGGVGNAGCADEEASDDCQMDEVGVSDCRGPSRAPGFGVAGTPITMIRRCDVGSVGEDPWSAAQRA